MKPKPLSFYWRVIDYLMIPLMKLISLAPFERPQESHAWHAQKIGQTDIESMNLEKCVQVEGYDSSYIKTGAGPLFHIPLIGGWKDYIVLQVDMTDKIWHVGWIVRESKSLQVLRSEIHKLPLFENKVRLLVGPIERVTTFFATNNNGIQLPLKIIGKGKMGDGSNYSKVRLF